MGMNVGSADGSSDPEVMMDINTTPLIDVMLVLLVMLIITIPIQLHAVNLEHAGRHAAAADVKPRDRQDRHRRESTVYWNGVADRRTGRRSSAEDAGGGRAEPAARIHLRPNKASKYDVVADVLADRQAPGPDQDRHDRQRAVHRVSDAMRLQLPNRTIRSARGQGRRARHRRARPASAGRSSRACARKAVEVIKKPLEATVIQEVKLPPPPPPPPPPPRIVKPPEIKAPPKIEAPPPPPFVPPPEVTPPPAPAPAITSVPTPPPAPPVIAPPPPPAPPAPPAAAGRSGRHRAWSVRRRSSRKSRARRCRKAPRAWSRRRPRSATARSRRSRSCRGRASSTPPCARR